MNSGTADFSLSGATSSYNMSSDATGSLTNKTASNQFISTAAGSEDLRLKSGADAINAGTDVGTTPTGVELDILGLDRNAAYLTWDIGAHEYIGTGPTYSIGTTNRDFSTIVLWESALDSADLYDASDDAVGEMYADSVFNEIVTINGGGTVGLSSITLTAADGEGHEGYDPNDATAAVTIDRDGNYTAVLGLSGTTVPMTVSDLIIKNLFADGSNGWRNGGIILNGAAGSVAQRCILHDLHADTVSWLNNGISETGWNAHYINNNIVYDCDNEGSGPSRGISVWNGAGYVYNNTAVNNVSVGGTGYGIAMLYAYARNNLSCDNDVDISSGSMYDEDYNATSDTTATGANSIDEVTPAFVSTAAGSEDYHLTSGSTDVIDEGYNVGTSYGVNYDIDGVARTGTWDIGADQYVLVSSPVAFEHTFSYSVTNDIEVEQQLHYSYNADYAVKRIVHYSYQADTIAVAVTGTTPLDWTTEVAQESVVPTSWQGGTAIMQTMSTPIAWLADMGTVSQTTPVGFGADLAWEATTPVSWQGEAEFNVVTSMPVDWRADLSHNRATYASWTAVLGGGECYYQITGTTTPDITGDYYYETDYDGYPVYKREDGSYYLWCLAGVIWYIQESYGDFAAAPRWYNNVGWEGTYFAFPPEAVGNATATKICGGAFVADATPVANLASSRQGRTTNVEYLGNHTLEAEIPVEWSGQTAINVLHAMPVGWGAELTLADEIPVDYLSSFQHDRTSEIEYLGGSASIAQVPVEWSLGVLLSREIPVSWQGQAVISQAMTVPVEWLGSTQQENSPPVAWEAEKQLVNTVPVSWMGDTVFTVIDTVPVAWVADKQLDDTIPVDWKTVTEQQDRTVPVAYVNEVEQDREMPVGWLAQLSHGRTMPIAWGGEQVLTVLSSLPISWKAELQQEQTGQVSYTADITTMADTTEVSWLQRTASDGIVPVGWLGNKETTILRAMPVDWTAQVGLSSAMPVDYLADVQTVGRELNYDAQLQMTTGMIIPVEWRGSTQISVLSQMPVSWTTPASAAHQVHYDHVLDLPTSSETLEFGYLLGTKQADVIPISWTIDTVFIEIARGIPVEWWGFYCVCPSGTWVLDERGTAWELDTRPSAWVLGAQPTQWLIAARPTHWVVDARPTNWTLGDR
jgi:hypothetical protein